MWTWRKHYYKQTKEQMLMTNLPTAPWQKVGTDLFNLNGKDYLLVIDYDSNFPEVVQFSSTSHSLSSHTWGVIFWDMEFINLSSVTTVPNMAAKTCWYLITYESRVPTSKCQGEGVQIVTRLLRKASNRNTDPYFTLLSDTATSLQCGASTTLPHILENNDNRNNDRLADKLRLKHRQKSNCDKTAKPLEPLQENDSVRVKGSDLWARKSTVLREAVRGTVWQQLEDESNEATVKKNKKK